jgi:hypothetical protein
MGKYIGDFAEDATVRGSFNTRDSAGAPITLAGTPVLSVYKDAGVSESTAGVTLTVDFDSRTGHHVFTIDTSADAFYATGSDYRVVITTGTVDGTSVVGVEVGAFSIQNRYSPSGSGLDAAGVRAAVGLATANLDTQLADLPTVAEFDARSLPSADYFVVSDYTTPPTVSQVADEVQTRTIARVTLVDTTTANTDMRGTDNALLAANYTTPPTASANATQVRTELTTELGRIDATISSRSTFAGGAVASVTDPVTVATNNDKTGYALATAPPTASEVATQVRTELSTELARVDVATSTRLATSGYTAPPTASANASQVRTELSTELARIDATVSSRSTLTAENVWEHATRSLTTFGTLVSDIWSNATRTLTAISDSSGITTLLGRIAGTLAAGTHEPQTGDSFARLGAPAGASIAADIAAIEGGGAGDTAEEIVDEIVARGITAIPVQSGVTSSGNLELIQGDTYNGTAKPLLSFPTSANYTDGWTATLTIRDEEDAVIATASGVVVSSTQVTVSFTTPTGLAFTGCPGVWQGKFDVQMSKSTQRATIARGIAYVYEDQTRS